MAKWRQAIAGCIREDTMEDKTEQIRRLKQDTDSVILAHYYTPGEVQAVADYVGDSYYLAEVAARVEQQTICFCGVRFMGESAKVLNPAKRVLLPAGDADCPMAHMADVGRIRQVRREYPDAAVVCYVNSDAELKAHSDVCVTSSNAEKIVEALPNQHIYFIPDEHLGRYIAARLPQKHFIFNDGFCHVHTEITAGQVEQARAAHPGALVLAHPECSSQVSGLADYVGSTAGIIAYAAKSQAEEFIVCTETGVFYQLQQENPHKHFYPAREHQVCPNMKKITLDKVIHALEAGETEVELPADFMERAHAPLRRMLELAGK